jgi:hypothetical protein
MSKEMREQINKVKNFGQFLSEAKFIRPIQKLIINDIEINDDTDWKSLYDNDKDAEFYAYDLYRNNAYPNYLKREVEKRYGKQKWVIIPSNHKKYSTERKENPEWFKID